MVRVFAVGGGFNLKYFAPLPGGQGDSVFVMVWGFFEKLNKKPYNLIQETVKTSKTASFREKYLNIFRNRRKLYLY
jgi:hypothetical protein